LNPGFGERADKHRDRHQTYHREDINRGWVDVPGAKIPNEVRNREHPKWKACHQHYGEQGGPPPDAGLNTLFAHLTQLSSCSGLNTASSHFTSA